MTRGKRKRLPLGSHSVSWMATSSAGRFRRPVRNAHRWRLWFCADYVRRLSSRLLAFYALSKPVHPPSGGGGGNRTRVQNVSSLPELRLCGHYAAGGQGFQAQSQISLPDLLFVSTKAYSASALKQIEYF